MRALLLAGAAMLLPGIAMAVPYSRPTAASIGAVAANGGNASGTMVTATGSSVARSQAARAADVINVMDFGAIGDDQADDTAAINAALAYARTKVLGAGQPYVGVTGPFADVVFPAGHRYRINGTLNVTGFSSGLVVDMKGAALDCHATGKTCIDAYDSSGVVWNLLTLVGDPTDMPNIGLAQGRSTYANGAFTQAVHVLYNTPTITGQFKFASFYNFAGEIMTMFHPTIQNYSGLTGSYGVVEDGYNHFGVTSSFITSANPAPANSWASFNENLFIEANIQTNVGDTIPIWMGGANRPKFINTYVAGGSPTCTHCYGMVLYNTGGQNTTLLDADLNFETSYLTDVFFFTGDNTLLMNGFHFREPQAGATNSIFKLDSNITQVQLQHADIEMLGYTGSAKLFDSPSKWRFFGQYSATNYAGFTPPAYGQILLDVGGQEQLASYGGAPIAAQIADNTTVGGNARGSYAVDMQSTRTQASQVAGGVAATIAGGQNNTATGVGSFAVGNGVGAYGQGAAAMGSSTTAAGAGSLAAGLGAQAYGTSSVALGAQSHDHNNAGSWVYADGQFTNGGDAQIGRHVLAGYGSGSGAIRLLAGGSTNPAPAVSPAVCIGLPASYSFGMRIHVHATDYTTRGSDYDWYLPEATLTRDGAPSTTAYTAGMSATTITRGTTTGASVSATADTTNACLNLSFTPPSANTTDVWHVVAQVDTVEMQ